MSLAEIKEQAAALPPLEQAELAAFLAERLRREDPDYQRELARLAGDPDPQHWVRWQELKVQDGR